jgi:hypothetical protein
MKGTHMKLYMIRGRTPVGRSGPLHATIAKGLTKGGLNTAIVAAIAQGWSEIDVSSYEDAAEDEDEDED